MKNDSSRFGHIIKLFTVLLTAILISLFFAVLVLVGKIQGTARRKMISSEGGPPTSKASASAAASWTWCGWTTRIFRPR